MYKYERILYWSENEQKFIVEVPELAGCIADGNTAVEAMENVEIVMDEWIETSRKIGRKIPEPKKKLDFILSKIEKLDLIENEVKDIKLILENEIGANIQSVAESHFKLSENLYDTIKTSCEVEMLTIKVRALESEVRELKRKIS